MATELYVGNLPFSASENDIRQHFAKYGELQSVRLIDDRNTGQPRAFDFVKMDNAVEVVQSLDGRSLRFNEAQERGGQGGEDGCQE